MKIKNEHKKDTAKCNLKYEMTERKQIGRWLYTEIVPELPIAGKIPAMYSGISGILRDN